MPNRRNDKRAISRNCLSRAADYTTCDYTCFFSFFCRATLKPSARLNCDRTVCLQTKIESERAREGETEREGEREKERNYARTPVEGEQTDLVRVISSLPSFWSYRLNTQFLRPKRRKAQVYKGLLSFPVTAGQECDLAQREQGSFQEGRETRVCPSAKSPLELVSPLPSTCSFHLDGKKRDPIRFG